MPFPVFDTDGQPLGSFCVMDLVARTWSDDDLDTLGVLAQAASSQIALLAAVRAEARSQGELRVAQQAEGRAQSRLDQLAGVTLALLSANSLEALTEIIISQALPVLGVDGGAVVVRDDDHFRLAVSGRLHERVQAIYGELPLDSPLPACHVARTGEVLVLANRQAGLAFHPGMEQVYADTERPSWAFLPLSLGDAVLGSLSVAWTDERDSVPTDELELIAAFAAQCTQALARIRADLEQRAVAEQLQRLSETLQRSLLTQPTPGSGAMTVAVRYLPAIRSAQVGGDWYDVHPAGSSTLVSVGDVAGHDRNAAAGMAALRNVLRGLAVHSDASPAELLRDLDLAVERLDLDLLATALAGRVEPHPDAGRGRALQLRWASAGHPRRWCGSPTGRSRSWTTNPTPCSASPRIAPGPNASPTCPRVRCCCCTPTACWSDAARASAPAWRAWPRSSPRSATAMSSRSATGCSQACCRTEDVKPAETRSF